RLLGQRGLPVARSTLEAALVDGDPRVRLAAAEAMRPPWKERTVQRVAAALRDERHPVVSQALVQLLTTMVKRPPARMSRAARAELVAGAFELFGKAGWRTDMDLVDLVEQFPSKAAVPFLIEALDLERPADELVAAVNERASPLLRQRAGSLLRAMTGALVPVEDAQAWRAFWAAEADNIEVPEQLRAAAPEATRVAFFGVPVTGTSIAFLIDTSGSMQDPPGTEGPVTGPRRVRRARTRLAAAKEQLTLATQAMEEGSQFFLLTFADDARTWTKQPMRPGRDVTRGLTGLLSRLNAHGGTNLYAGLVAALEIEGRSFGAAELPKIDELFVLSDGQPTTGPARDADTLCELVREANKYAKIRINAVFTGVGPGGDLLQRLASENGGVFVGPGPPGGGGGGGPPATRGGRRGRRGRAQMPSVPSAPFDVSRFATFESVRQTACALSVAPVRFGLLGIGTDAPAEPLAVRPTRSMRTVSIQTEHPGAFRPIAGSGTPGPCALPRKNSANGETGSTLSAVSAQLPPRVGALALSVSGTSSLS
ncbi:MAG: VWA domain-containing protein, partial [Planctomycetota bacterium]